MVRYPSKFFENSRFLVVHVNIFWNNACSPSAITNHWCSIISPYLSETIIQFYEIQQGDANFSVTTFNKTKHKLLTILPH